MRIARAAGVVFLALAAGLAAPALAQAPPPSYLFRLADFSGELPYDHVPIHVDERHHEVYVAEADAVRIFNASGMQIFEFFHDRKLGSILDLCVGPEGDIFALSYENPGPDREGGSVVTRFDYRGRIRESLRPDPVPEGPPEFLATYLECPKEGLFWVDAWRKLVLRTDRSGRVERAWDLGEAAASSLGDEERAKNPGSGGEITGFSIDRNGRFLFSIAVFFKGFRMDPETGEIEAFGRAGSAPGKFGLVAGVAEDAFGQIYVADRARSVVLVFDGSFRFIREFGTRGPAVTRLAYPHGLAYGKGRLYVSQWQRRGISVFSVGEP